MPPYPAATQKSTYRWSREAAIPNTEVKILREERSGFRQEAPPRKERALTPSMRLRLSPAGPMVRHAPSVWERRSLPAQIKATFRNECGLFLSWRVFFGRCRQHHHSFFTCLANRVGA